MGLGWIDRGLRRTGVISALHRGNRLDIRKVVPPMTQESRRRLQELSGGDTLQLASILGRESLPWRTWRAATGRDGSDAGEASA